MDSISMEQQQLSTLEPCTISSNTSKHIPLDIIIDIISRLPVKSILRFKSVSKSWCKAIKDPSLADLHLSRATEEPGMLFPLKDKTLLKRSDLSPATLCLAKDDGPRGNTIIRAPFAEFGNYYRLEGSCNGLVCLYKFIGDPRMPTLICNFALQEYIVLPVDSLQRAYPCYNGQKYKLAFCPGTKEYKVVWYNHAFRKSQVSYKYASVCKIHTLGGSSWRDIISPHRIYGTPVLANGGLHWKCYENHITSLNLEKEEFHVTDYPTNLRSKSTHTRMNLFEMRGFLAVAEFSFNDHMDVWVLRDDNKKQYWVKEYTFMINLVTSPHKLKRELGVPPVFHAAHLTIIGLWQQDKILFKYADYYISYDTKTYEVVDIKGFGKQSCGIGKKSLGIGKACSFTRSLVSLKPYGSNRIF